MLKVCLASFPLKPMMLTEEIINNWSGTPAGMLLSIVSLAKEGYETWTMRENGEYGVVIPLKSSDEISEYFSGAHLYTVCRVLDDMQEHTLLYLTSNKEEIKEQFASLCAELVAPGENGAFRKEIEVNPLGWWVQWKELLGNKNVDLRAYDVLGELWALRYLAEQGEHAEWNGPSGATYDIDCDSYYTEVKSTTARNKKQITLSNLFQLTPPDGKKLYLILCQFEVAQSGISINSLVDDLGNLGYNVSVINEKLAKQGLEKGKTARKRTYDIHSVTRYEVNEAFPAIRPESFVGGDLPEGVMSITYTITLDGIAGEKLL